MPGCRGFFFISNLCKCSLTAFLLGLDGSKLDLPYKSVGYRLVTGGAETLPASHKGLLTPNSLKHQPGAVHQGVSDWVISSVKTGEHSSLGKSDMEQTAAAEVIDDASLPFPSAELNRQPDVLMLTKPDRQTHTHAAQR